MYCIHFKKYVFSFRKPSSHGLYYMQLGLMYLVSYANNYQFSEIQNENVFVFVNKQIIIANRHK